MEITQFLFLYCIPWNFGLTGDMVKRIKIQTRVQRIFIYCTVTSDKNLCELNKFLNKYLKNTMFFSIIIFANKKITKKSAIFLDIFLIVIIIICINFHLYFRF